MKIRMSAIFVALWLALAGAASAQETTGTLTGKLTDTQGLAVPGATVTVTGPQGAKSFVTDADGTFRVPFLTPGTYDVRAELQGFKTVEQKAVAGQPRPDHRRLAASSRSAASPRPCQVTGSDRPSSTRRRRPPARCCRASCCRACRSAAASPTRSTWRPASAAAARPVAANPSISGGTGLDNQYVVDGVNVTNTGYGALGSYSIIFGSLGNATPFDFVKEVQVKTGGYEAEFGQSIGGVVNVVTKSGTQRPARLGVRLHAADRASRRAYKTFQSPNGTVNTRRPRSRSDAGVEAGFPIIQEQAVLLRRHQPAVGDAHVHRAATASRCAASASVDRKRRTLSYSAKAHLAARRRAHRIDASFFGDPSKGDIGPQRTSALLGHRHLVVQRARVRRPQPDRALRRRRSARTCCSRRRFARAYNKITETPSVDTWRVTDTTVTPNVITGGIGFYEAGQQEHEQPVHRQGDRACPAATRSRYGVPVRRRDYTQINQRTGPTFMAPDGRRPRPARRSPSCRTPTFGQIYRVTRANFNIGRTTTQNYWSFFVQDTWRVGDRLTINPGLRYEQETLGTFGTITRRERSRFPLKNNWAPRIGAIYDVLGDGKHASCTATTAASTRASRTTWRPARCRPTTASAAPTTSTPT